MMSSLLGDRFKDYLEKLVQTKDIAAFVVSFTVLEKDARALFDREDKNWEKREVKFEEMQLTVKKLKAGQNEAEDLRTILHYSATSTFIPAHKKEIALILYDKYWYKASNQAARKTLGQYLAAKSGQVVVDGAAGGSVVMQVESAGGVGPAEATGAAAVAASGAVSVAGPVADPVAAPAADPVAAPAADPVADPDAARNAMRNMLEAQAQLDASVAESKKAFEKFEKASRDFKEAVKALNKSRKRARS
jgi:hypothetical protein